MLVMLSAPQLRRAGGVIAHRMKTPLVFADFYTVLKRHQNTAVDWCIACHHHRSVILHSAVVWGFLFFGVEACCLNG